jgi:dihydropteroate synthase
MTAKAVALEYLDQTVSVQVADVQITADQISNDRGGDKQEIDIQANLRKSDRQLKSQTIDDQLSQRPLDLDPAGYWIIYLDRENLLICAKYFSNNINEQGLAVDPENGKVIPARAKVQRVASQIFQANTAKELCVQIFENSDLNLVSLFDHAAYIGRETQKAELALINDSEYIQD